MALKDWKRENKWLWSKGSHAVVIERDWFGKKFKKEDFYVRSNINGYISKGFKTKSQALKFARAYMRTH